MVTLMLLSLLPFLQYPGIEQLGSSSSSGVGILLQHSSKNTGVQGLQIRQC